MMQSQSKITFRTTSRSALSGALLLGLLPFGCAAGIDDDEWEEAEPISEGREGLVFNSLPFPLHSLPVEIKNVNSGKCLDIAGAGAQNGANAQQFTCNSGTNQTFMLVLSRTFPATYQIRIGHTGNKNLNVANSSTADNANIDISDVVSVGQLFGFEKQSDGNYRIFSSNSNKCLDVANASTANNANVQQFTCHSGTNQRWTITPRSSSLHLIAKHSERCVDVAGASTGNNANVQQFDCGEGGHQRWSLGASSVSGGITYFPLVASHSGKCMDVADGSVADNANVQQFTCHGGDNQKWQVIDLSDGYVSFKNKTSGKCLDVAGAATGNNANIQQFTCNNGDNQRFYWSIFESRHIQVVQAGRDDGTGRMIQSNTAIGQHVARSNGVYGRYGLRLIYDSAVNKSNVDSSALRSLGCSPAVPPDPPNPDCPALDSYTCEDGSIGTRDQCAMRFAANWPNKVVLISRDMGAFSSGNANYIAMGRMGSNSDLVCGDVPNTQWLAHEFGHYMGIGHTFTGDGDLLSDTRSDSRDGSCLPPGANVDCLAPHSATGTLCDGTVVDTNNVVSYYYNASVRITPMQARVARAGAYSRGY